MSVSQQCVECKHYSGYRMCPAFPTGIPKKFFVGSVEHDTVVEPQIAEVTHEVGDVNKGLDDAFISVIKGGQGSGNWGHDGQGGSWGGSSETGGTSEAFLELDPEVRPSFDPDTGNFSRERHDQKKEEIYEEDGNEAVQEYNNRVNEVLEEEPQRYEEDRFMEEETDELNAEQYIREDGSIDVEGVREATENMTMREKFNKRLEVVDKSMEARQQHAKEKEYEILDSVEGYELSDYGTKSFEEVYPELADDDDFTNNTNTVLVVEGKNRLIPKGMEEEVLRHIEEFNAKETLGEQQRYLDEEIEIPSLNWADEGERLDFHTREGRNAIKAILSNRVNDAIYEASEGDHPNIYDDLEGNHPYLIEQENKANLPVLINDSKIVSSGLYGDNSEAVAERFREDVQEGQDFIEKHANGEYNKLDMPIDINPATGRGTYSKETREINVSVSDHIAGTTIHELGHALHRENSIEREEMIKNFFQDRTEGEELTVIHTDQFGNVERGYKDDFISHYTGKVYDLEGHIGTEILSVGVQALYDDPEEFRMKDKEHFNLTVACLEGLI